MGRWWGVGLGLAAALPLHAQTTPFAGLEELFTPPKGYVVQHTSQPLTIDGNLRESDWLKAPWTTDFVDIEGAKKPLPPFQTRVKMLWNDSTLFIAATLQEPQIWAYQTHHDDIIYKDNDFEVFIDPDNNAHQYFEVEVNALNKIFDLYLPKPYRDKGDALISWDAAGLRSGVALSGTLNQPRDMDKSWTVEIAIPLRALRMGFPWQPPAEGALWRINFSRVEWDTKAVGAKNVKLQDASGKDRPEHNWVWSPQGVVNMHYPERWGYLQFTRRAGTTWQLPAAEVRKQYLWLVYYRQQRFKEKNGRYAATLAELGIAPQVEVDNQANQLELAATPYQFTATITAAGGAPIRLNDEGLIETLKP
ncbi:hypothetical protein EAH73_01035 [Hymenobacter nivis]|uniref:Carbohydrate-binding domain-containing protein n=1 Tax=Hymenobacter nivis TaxID=1850093 RepID=A0A502HFU3_9BACT|nr:hypothetical protein EAH73_01035 [Hymenobacter nivis]